MAILVYEGLLTPTDVGGDRIMCFMRARFSCVFGSTRLVKARRVRMAIMPERRGWVKRGRTGAF